MKAKLVGVLVFFNEENLSGEKYSIHMSDEKNFELQSSFKLFTVVVVSLSSISLDNLSPKWFK